MNDDKVLVQNITIKTTVEALKSMARRLPKYVNLHGFYMTSKHAHKHARLFDYSSVNHIKVEYDQMNWKGKSKHVDEEEVDFKRYLFLNSSALVHNLTIKEVVIER